MVSPSRTPGAQAIRVDVDPDAFHVGEHARQRQLELVVELEEAAQGKALDEERAELSSAGGGSSRVLGSSLDLAALRRTGVLALAQERLRGGQLATKVFARQSVEGV